MAEGQFKEGIAGGRLSPSAIRRQFFRPASAARPARGAGRADRCYFCYDAPCMKACPTAHRHPAVHPRDHRPATRSAPAKTIFDQNILGGMCARVCPTETLCEEACVREDGRGQAGRDRPAAALRHRRRDGGGQAVLRRAPRRPASSVAVVGAGPAGLACAHRLALHGHDVTIFEARPKAGGLNEYGIAAYKTRRRFRAGRGRLHPVDRRHRASSTASALGRDISARRPARRSYDAVFLGVGLGGVNALRAEGEDARRASRTRSTSSPSCARPTTSATLPVGRRVVVIGGGMTAVDAAVQSKLLGAEDVTIVYRRGQEQMNASRIRAGPGRSRRAS